MARPERLLVWGAGGHGKVVAELARAAGARVVGFADADPARLGRTAEPGGAEVVITEAELRLRLAAGMLPAAADGLLLALGDNALRWAARRAAAAVALPALAHPTAWVSPGATLGAGALVMARAVVHPDARVGEAALINTGAIVEHDCRVGDGAHLSPGAVLAGGAVVGARAAVGAGAVVLPGIQVGEGAVVGAGAVVTRDVPAWTTVVGVPARILRPPMEGAA